MNPDQLEIDAINKGILFSVFLLGMVFGGVISLIMHSIKNERHRDE